MLCERCQEFFHWVQGPTPEGFDSEEFYHHSRWQTWYEGIAQHYPLCIWMRHRDKLTPKINDLLEGTYSLWVAPELLETLNIDGSLPKLRPTIFWRR